VGCVGGSLVYIRRCEPGPYYLWFDNGTYSVRQPGFYDFHLLDDPRLLRDEPTFDTEEAAERAAAIANRLSGATFPGGPR